MPVPQKHLSLSIFGEVSVYAQQSGFTLIELLVVIAIIGIPAAILPPALARAWDQIAYIQVGDNPGRKEPGTGEINYHNIFRHLYRKGYSGLIGMEHGIAGDGPEGERNLIAAYRAADNFPVS